MGTRKLGELRAGLVLAEDVLTPGGRFLMPRGTVLDAGHLGALASWEVPEVAVREEASASPAGPPEPVAAGPDRSDRAAGPLHDAVLARIRARFPAEADDQEPWPVLLRLAVDRELARAAEPREGDPEVPRSEGGVALAPLSAEAVLRDEPKLVSPPEVYQRVCRVLHDPNSTVDDAAEAIRHDPSLAAKLLRLVNSSFYARTMRAVQGRFPAKIDSLPRAVMVVGARQLSTLALGVSVLPLFQDIPQSWFDMRGFWEHSVGCAVAAQALAAATGRVNPETAFVAGLMHDIGRVILLKQAPRHMAAALRLALAQGLPLVAAERAVLGFDHAALGGLLLGKWQFPANLEGMVRDHHAPRPDAGLAEAALVQLADVVANALAWGNGGSRHAPSLSPASWEALALAPDSLENLVPLMEESLVDTMRGFFPDRSEPA